MSKLLIGGKDFRPYIPADSTVVESPRRNVGIEIWDGAPAGDPQEMTEGNTNISFYLIDTDTSETLTFNALTTWSLSPNATGFATLSFAPGVGGPNDDGVAIMTLVDGTTWPVNQPNAVTLSMIANYDGSIVNWTNGFYVNAPTIGFDNVSAAIAQPLDTVSIGTSLVLDYPLNTYAPLSISPRILANKFACIQVDNTTASFNPTLFNMGTNFEPYTVRIYNSAISLVHTQNIPGSSSNVEITYVFPAIDTYYLVFQNTGTAEDILTLLVDGT